MPNQLNEDGELSSSSINLNFPKYNRDDQPVNMINRYLNPMLSKFDKTESNDIVVGNRLQQVLTRTNGHLDDSKIILEVVGIVPDLVHKTINPNMVSPSEEQQAYFNSKMISSGKLVRLRTTTVRPTYDQIPRPAIFTEERRNF